MAKQERRLTRRRCGGRAACARQCAAHPARVQIRQLLARYRTAAGVDTDELVTALHRVLARRAARALAPPPRAPAGSRAVPPAAAATTLLMETLLGPFARAQKAFRLLDAAGSRDGRLARAEFRRALGAAGAVLRDADFEAFCEAQGAAGEGGRIYYARFTASVLGALRPTEHGSCEVG